MLEKTPPFVIAVFLLFACWGSGGSIGDSPADGSTDSDVDTETCPEGKTFHGNAGAFDTTSLNALEGYSKVTGDLLTTGDVISDLDGLQCLTSVGKRLIVSLCKNLTSLNGLQSLAEIGELFSLNNNDSLVHLNHLHSLKSISGGLNIVSNSSLSNIESLYGILHFDGSLAIIDNPQLPTCQAEKLRSILEEQGWTGDSLIMDNNDDLQCEE